MPNNDRSTLGYLGEDFQYRLVHSLMDDKDFFRDLYDILDQNMFTNPQLRRLVYTMKEYYSKNETVPSYEMLTIKLNEKDRTEQDREITIGVLNRVREYPSDGVLDIRESALKFFKQQHIVKTANTILKIAGDGDTDKYDDCVELLNEAMRKGLRDNLGSTVFENLKETLSDDYRIVIPTGIGKIDETLEGGIGKGELGVIIGPSSFGKAQPLDAKIITPNGFKQMGDIKVDDEVIGCDGKPHKVVGVFKQGIRQIYKVSFSNDTSCECDIEHLWTVLFDFNSMHKTLTLREIMDMGLKNNDKYRFSIPFNYPIHIENDEEFPIDLFHIGSHIFDGKEDKYYSLKGKSSVSQTYHNETMRLLDENNGVLPMNYIFSSDKNRKNLFRGIVVQYARMVSVGKYEITIDNEELKYQFSLLLRSFGGEMRTVVKDSGIKVIEFSLYDDFINPFMSNKNLFGEYTKYITNIEYVGEKDAQCIMVHCDEHLYLTENFILTHNTSMTTSIASHAATYRCEQNDNQGFKVLQIIFEDRIKQIQRKHIGKITGIEAKDLSKPEFKEKVDHILSEYKDKEMLNKNLRIVKFSSGEKTAQDIKMYIKKLINSGFTPDLCIIDYFECLVHPNDGTTSNEYEKEGKTMRKLESMASEFNMALWVPTQGVKDSVNAELVTMDKAGGSFKKIQIAHIVMSIARSMEDIEANRATIAVLKNRAGKSGTVLNNVEFNNGTCRICTDHVDEFDNMIEYRKNSQKLRNEIAIDIYNKTKL